MRLKGKTAVITGSGSGVGRATSLLFAREGATVVGVDIDAQFGKETAELVRREGGTAEFYAADVGDPDAVAFTSYCMSLGWEGKNTAFDLLPLVIQRQGEPASWFALPEEKVLRVALSHPDYTWFKELGLQWYAVPVISDMRLEIGGISFPCAPFNGWYMLTEIAARNLGDVQRYNLLPVLAKKLNLDTRQVKTLWKDKALQVLQEAVLHSFQSQGVTLVDHHTASEQFLEFCKQEESKGRVVQADWAWIVPPTASSTLGVFHQEWDNQILSPNFHYQSAPWKEEERAKEPTSTVKKCPFSAN